MSFFMIYGATGYVGEHVARVAAQSGMKPIVAGRDGAKLRRLAAELGLENRAFSLEDPAAVDRGLADVGVVLNCAGPFMNTAEPIVDVCLRTGAHYLDITGEIPVYEALQALDANARAHGVMLLPGVGFDVVPTDCLALHLKNRLSSATRLTLAFQIDGPAGLPPGTQRTAIELLRYGDRVRRDGHLTRPEKASKTMSVDFGQGSVRVRLLPWGDIFTAYFSTGIPNIEDYAATSPEIARQTAIGRVIAPLTKFGPVRALLKMAVRPGPTADARDRTRTHVWGEVADNQGRTAISRLHGPEAGVVWTTMTAIAAARKALSGAAPAGYQTPATAYGADFVLEAGDVTREDVI
jgi:short subunit dehydrogenase-like uncharacterized protein